MLIGVAQRSIRSLDDSRARPLRLQTRQAPSAMALCQLRAQLAQLRLDQLSLIAATGNPAQVAHYDRRIQQSLRGAHTQVALYIATRPSGAERRRFAGVQAELDAYLSLHRQISAAVRAGDRERAGELSTHQALPPHRALFPDLEALNRLDARQALHADADAPAYATR